MTFQTIPAKEYFAIDALSCSGLKAFADCPARFKFQKENPIEPTPSMILGTAVHSMVLEPELNAVLECQGTRATKAFKEMVEDNPDKLVLPKNDFETASNMAKALCDNQYVKELLKTGKPEQTAIYQNGVKMKARYDWVCAERDIIVDLKTTADASPEGFGKQVFNTKYHWQAYWYSHLYELVTGRKPVFIFACVESKEPHLTAVYQVPEQALTYAAHEIAPLIERYKECYVLDDWPSYFEGIQAFEVPAWINKQMDLTI